MQSSVAEVSKWIQRQSQLAMSLPVGCSCRSEITAGIRQFREKEWKQTTGRIPRADRTDGTVSCCTLLENWQLTTAPLEFNGRDRETWLGKRAHQKASGSGGPDGTTGVEIHNLPGPVIDLFRTLTAIWEHTKMAPTSTSRIRQAALQKPGRPKSPFPTNPIAVMSAWWRLYESAWVQSGSFVAWRHTIGRGHKVAYVESGEQAVAATVKNIWRTPDGGYVAAMDFFQVVRPRGSRIVAASTGRSRMAKSTWPLCKEVCGRHSSALWASEGTRTVPPSKPLLPTSQGGPLGPTVCQVWPLGGAERTPGQ